MTFNDEVKKILVNLITMIFIALVNKVCFFKGLDKYKKVFK